MIGPFQVKGPAIGTEDTSATLTATFGDNTTGAFKVGREMDELMLYVSYTPKTGQSNRYALIRVELGDKSSDLYQETLVADFTGDSTLKINRRFDRVFPDSTGSVGGTEYKGRVSIPVADIWGRVSTRESGSSNFGAILIKTVITSKS